MELVQGETLSAAIQRGPIRQFEALKISRQIAEALEAAHEQNVVHRDLKPGNVMITPSGLVKVLDFGLATVIHPGPIGSSNPPDSATVTFATVAGTILGTAAYMSPEQAEGLPVDKRSDIWSYGVILWELFTGKRLFDAPSASRTLADVIGKKIDFSQLPAGTPPSLQTLIRRCLVHEPATRLRDIGEVRITIDSDKEPAGETSAPINSRTRFAWITTGISVVAFAAMALLYFDRTSPERLRAKFQISPPRIHTFLRLSPDGKHLAMQYAEGISSWPYGQSTVWRWAYCPKYLPGPPFLVTRWGICLFRRPNRQTLKGGTKRRRHRHPGRCPRRLYRRRVRRRRHCANCVQRHLPYSLFWRRSCKD